MRTTKQLKQTPWRRSRICRKSLIILWSSSLLRKRDSGRLSNVITLWIVALPWSVLPTKKTIEQWCKWPPLTDLSTKSSEGVSCREGSKMLSQNISSRSSLPTSTKIFSLKTSSTYRVQTEILCPRAFTRSKMSQLSEIKYSISSPMITNTFARSWLSQKARYFNLSPTLITYAQP